MSRCQLDNDTPEATDNDDDEVSNTSNDNEEVEDDDESSSEIGLSAVNTDPTGKYNRYIVIQPF